MKLIDVHVRNYRCLKDVWFRIHDLTVFIGENDSGKTAVLNLLDLVLNDNVPAESDYCNTRQIDENDTDSFTVAEEIEAQLVFEITEADRNYVLRFSADGMRVCYRKRYTLGSVSTSCHRQQYKIGALNGSYSNRNTHAQLDECLAECNVEIPADVTSKDDKVAFIESLRLSAETELAWSELSASDIRDLRQYLPRFERYQALDYQDPSRMIEKTLKEIYVSMLYEEVDQEIPEGSSQQVLRQLVPPLRGLESKIEERFNEKVSELQQFLEKYNPRIHRLSYKPKLDFVSGLRPGQLLVDAGHGLHPLTNIGDGTKRRMLMATIDWDRHILSEENVNSRPLIRGYDEPDTSLHYDAQRRMFEAIVAITRETDVQAIICTHSLAMIDRAPAQCINRLALTASGHTDFSHIVTNDDSEVEEFLSTMAADMGITNTMMFFERCYIVVEGQSEENSLPILYRRLYGRSLIEDGIRLINIEGNGGRKGLLKLLSKNRQHMTLILLDRDNVDTKREFVQAGFTNDRMETNTYLIGDTEFEDAFSNDAWALCLSAVWTRADGKNWSPEEINSIRTSRKFSESLMSLIHRMTIDGPMNRKPIVASEIARHCPRELIPSEIQRLFEHARMIAEGVEEQGLIETVV